MEGERHNTKRQGEADGERSAEEAMVEGRDGRTKEGRGGRAARTGREQTAPAGHFETFAKNASYMGGLREGWIEKHSNKEEATGGRPAGLLHEYMGHDVSNMRGFDSYRLLTLSLAALMTRISSVVIEGAHTSAGAATLARTVPFWGRFRSPREPTAGPCRGCLLPSATNTAPSRHHLQAVLCDGWDVQTPPSWLLRPQTRELYGWS